MIIGAFAGDAVFDRIAEYGDGWIPINELVPPNWREKLAVALKRHGRATDSISMTMLSIFPGDAFADDAVAAGFERIVFMVPSEPREKVMPLIEQYAATARRLSQVPVA